MNKLLAYESHRQHARNAAKRLADLAIQVMLSDEPVDYERELHLILGSVKVYSGVDACQTRNVNDSSSMNQAGKEHKAMSLQSRTRWCSGCLAARSPSPQQPKRPALGSSGRNVAKMPSL